MKPSDRNPSEPISVTLEVDRGPVEGQARVRSQDFGRHRNASSYEMIPVEEHQLRDYLRIIEKRKGIVALVFFGVLAITFLYTFTRVPIYRAEALLEYGKDGSSSINNIGEGIAQSLGHSDNETFATQAGILKSRSLAEALLNKLNLENSPEFASNPGVVQATIDKAVRWFDEIVNGPSEPVHPSQEKERLVKEIADRFKVKRENQSRLIRLTCDAKDPELAETMLKTYVDLYMEQNLAKRRMVNRDAGTWLKSELTNAEEKLVASMKNLVQFTNDHGIVSLDEGSNHVITFFNKAAEGLVKTKEQRVQLEAFQKEGINDLTVLPAEAKPDDFRALKEKLSILESEHNNMREIYSDDYPKLVLHRKQIAFLKEKVAEHEKRLVASALETAKTQEMLQEEAFEKAKQEAMANNSLGVQSAVLKKEVETNGEIYKLLLQKSKELELNTQVIGNNINVVDRPIAPLRPVKPEKGLYLLIGSILGLAGGIMVAFALEQLDNSVHSTDDIERKLSLPTLGVVPDVQKLRRQHHLNGKRMGFEFLAHDAPKSPVSEAIKNIKTSIFLSLPARTIRTLVIASSGPREGKTFVSVSIASVLCSQEKKVLIIDTDLRRPRIGKVFGHSDKIPGLTTLLTRDDVKLQKVLHKAKVPGLYYMTSGPLPPNPVALLESERMDRLIDRLTEIFDMVILDTPPLVGFSDTRILAAKADAVILVIKEAYLPVEFIHQAKSMVMASGKATLLGAVLNMANGSSSYYGAKYTRYYRYYDYSETNGNRITNLIRKS